MPAELHRAQDHAVIAFHDLVPRAGAIAANQYLVIHRHEAALIDPGGDLLFAVLLNQVLQLIRSDQLRYVLATHQDPDVAGGIARWFMSAPVTVVASHLWGRFLQHSVPGYQVDSGEVRYQLLPDEGGRIRFADGYAIEAVPAHFLHSPGNFHFYDPISRILFCGDIGASNSAQAFGPVADFDAHVPTMRAFHQRYMASRIAGQVWAERVRRKDIRMLASQHGPYFEGADVSRLIEWVARERCGVDLLQPADVAADAAP